MAAPLIYLYLFFSNDKNELRLLQTVSYINTNRLTTVSLLFGITTWYLQSQRTTLGLAFLSVLAIGLIVEILIRSLFYTEKDLSFKDLKGEVEALSDKLGAQALFDYSDPLTTETLFIFFRGGWCGQCRTQIQEFYEQRKTFESIGLNIVWLSIQADEQLAKLRKTYPEFRFYSVDESTFNNKPELIDQYSTPAILKSLHKNNFRPHALIVSKNLEVILDFPSEAVAIRVSPEEVLKSYRDFTFARSLKLKVQEKTKSVQNLLRLLVHDISNPLTVVKGSTQLLRRTQEGLSEKSEKFLDRIELAIDSQEEIITSVRSLESLSSGKIRLNVMPERIYELVEQTVAALSDMTKKGQLAILVADHTENAMAKVDKASFKNQVLANLLTNAIKFTPENGEIHISINCVGDSDRVLVSILDSGIGMPDSIIEDLFDMSATTSRVGLHGQKGTGFGMPIVKEFVEAQQAEIFVYTKEKDKEIYPQHLSFKKKQGGALEQLESQESGTVFFLSIPKTT